MSNLFRNNQLRNTLLVIFAISLFGFVLALQTDVTVVIIWLVVVAILLVIAINALNNFYKEQVVQQQQNRLYTVSQQILANIPFGAILLDEKGNIDFINQNASQLFNKKNVELQNKPLKEIDEVFFEFVQKNVEENQNKFVPTMLNNRSISVQVDAKNRAIYVNSIKANNYKKDFLDHQLIQGIVAIDNYEEVIQDSREVDASQLRTTVTSFLDEWATNNQLSLRRINADRYQFIGYEKQLNILEKDEFSVINAIRKVAQERNMPVTISIGLAYGQEDLVALAKLAQNNLDLAFARGGDQVVVKSPDGEARFYGGTTTQVSKRTRVRARRVARALDDLFDQANSIYIVGHEYPDLDAIGAAIGIWRFATIRNKTAYIVLEEKQLQFDTKTLLNAIQQDKNNQELTTHIVSEQTAFMQSDEKSLVVLVDHSKMSVTQAPQLVGKLASNVLVIDHHRRSDEELSEKPVLSYVESSASSTSELVTELLQYEDRTKAPIQKIEATALMAGIQLDTANFLTNANARTFDAASFLRSIDADANLIQEMNKEPEESLLQRSHLIAKVQLVDSFAIVQAEEDETYDGVLVAQTADLLLGMQGVDASFVIAKRKDNRVIISARSNGQYNVQRVMEEFGGGGRLSVAAAQINQSTIQEVYDKLKALLNKQEKK